ncbi:MAG: 30S ribosomal protein S18 [Terriglobia bacterium]
MGTQPRSGPHPRKDGGGGKRQYLRKRKVCRFCVERIDHIDYKDVRLLSHFTPERSKILPSRISGVCAPHQRQLMRAIKRARNIALLPFAAES